MKEPTLADIPTPASNRISLITFFYTAIILKIVNKPLNRNELRLTEYLNIVAINIVDIKLKEVPELAKLNEPPINKIKFIGFLIDGYYDHANDQEQGAVVEDWFRKYEESLAKQN